MRSSMVKTRLMAAPAQNNSVLYVLVRSEDRKIYGGERSTLSSASGLASAGLRRPRFLVTSDDDVAAAARSAGFACEVVPVLNPFIGIRSRSWFGRIGKLRDLLRVNLSVLRRPAPIVHASLIHGFYCSWLGAKLAGAKTIYHIRTASRNQETRWFEELAVLLADRTIAVSDSLKAQIVDKGHSPLRPLLARRIEVIPNGFDFEGIDFFMKAHSKAACRAATGPAEGVSAVCVAGIRPDKGQLKLIERVLPEVVRRAPEFHLTFVGGDQDLAYAAACRDEVSRLRLDGHVQFAGYQDQESVHRWYRGADVAVLASEREGLPRVGVEAQAFGLPLVATGVVGSVDVVRHSRTGFLVKPEQLEQMAEHLVVLVQDAALRDRFGEAARENVRSRFSLHANVVGLERVYVDLSDTSSPPTSS